MFALFALGGIAFWILVSILSIAIIISLERESGFAATCSLIVALLIFYFCGGRNDLFDFSIWLKNHPVDIIIYVLAYFFIGTAWSFVKWYLFLVKLKESGIKQKDYRCEVSYNKDKVISWMTYWPFSVIWTFFDHPVKKAWNFIYIKTAKVYDNIAKQVFPE